jgi:hypothetical protein
MPNLYVFVGVKRNADGPMAFGCQIGHVDFMTTISKNSQKIS